MLIGLKGCVEADVRQQCKMLWLQESPDLKTGNTGQIRSGPGTGALVSQHEAYVSSRVPQLQPDCLPLGSRVRVSAPGLGVPCGRAQPRVRGFSLPLDGGLGRFWREEGRRSWKEMELCGPGAVGRAGE